MTSDETRLSTLRQLASRLDLPALRRMGYSKPAAELTLLHLREEIAKLHEEIGRGLEARRAAVAQARASARRKALIDLGTIRSADAFLSGLPYGYDGPFNWAFLPFSGLRGITPMDWDACVEINNWFLAFETKQYDKKIERGQMLAILAATRLRHPVRNEPAVHFVILEGKDGDRQPEPARSWNHVVDGRLLWQESRPCSPQQVADWCKRWMLCADKDNPTGLNYITSSLA